MRTYSLIFFLIPFSIFSCAYDSAEDHRGPLFVEWFFKTELNFPVEAATCPKGMTRDSLERFCKQYHEFKYLPQHYAFYYCTTAELCSWVDASEMLVLDEGFKNFLMREFIKRVTDPELYTIDLLPREDLIIPSKILMSSPTCSDALFTRAKSSHVWHDHSEKIPDIEKPRYFLPPSVRIVSAIAYDDGFVSVGTVCYKGIITDARGWLFCEYTIDFSSSQTENPRTATFEYDRSFEYDYRIIFSGAHYYSKKFSYSSESENVCSTPPSHKTIGDLLLDYAFEYRERGYSLNAMAIAIRYGTSQKSNVGLAVSRGVLDFVRPILKDRFHEFESAVQRIQWSKNFKELERASGAFCALAYSGLGLHKPHSMHQARIDFDSAHVMDFCDI